MSSNTSQSQLLRGDIYIYIYIYKDSFFFLSVFMSFFASFFKSSKLHFDHISVIVVRDRELLESES